MTDRSGEYRNLDNDLRNVPLPEGLFARLRQVALATDDDLDGALAQAEIPWQLRDRLLAIPLDDAALDSALTDTPLPEGLLQRLLAIPGRQLRVPQYGRLAVAASLFVLVGAAYLAASRFGPWNTQKLPVDSSTNVASSSDLPGTFHAQELPPQVEMNWPLATAPTPALVEPEAPAALPFVVAANWAETPYWQLQSWFQSDPDGSSKLWRLTDRWGVFGADASFDRLPDLAVVSMRTPRGISPPKSRGYDLLFAMTKGAHPFVSPNDPELKTAVVPVATRTSAYDAARRQVQNGSLPSPASVQIEEFLAAQDYRFIPPNRESLAIRTAAGPMPFGTGGTNSMLVGLQTAAPAKVERPTLITIAVDVSSSMRNGGRWDLTRRAIEDLVAQLGANDALSIIVFNQDAETIIEKAGASAVGTIRDRLAGIQPRGATNIGRGLQWAYATQGHFVETDPTTRHRIVLITDGLVELPAETMVRLSGMAGEAVRGGTTLDVIDLLAENRENTWNELAKTGGGRVWRAGDFSEVGSALRHVLAGGEVRTAARQVRLSVTFQPDSVESYRLVGHEPQLIADWAAEAVTVELAEGDAAVGLFEVRLKAGQNEEVANVDVTWRDTAGQSHRARQRITRVQFASSFAEAPLPLQLAALAAESAELLRESPYGTGVGHSWERLLSATTLANARLRQRPGFQEWLSFAQQAARLKAARTGG